jgi:di/tricarboxylate transporter
MNTEQLIVFGVLGATLALFIWGRWRYDIVALIALLAMVISGLVPSERAFAGFGHPAVVTVAAVLVLSRGLLNAGVVDSIARYMGRVGVNPTMQVAALTGLVALCSAFMNNVGALALLMPVAVWMSRQAGRSPSLLLMPLAFGSLLGGTVTLIGTPPNIIIAAYRAETGVQPFGMFDFLPVGAGITIAGLIFITLVGWRLTPRRQENSVSKDELFKISDYIIEVRVPAESKFAGGTLHDLQVAAAADDVEMIVIGLVRGKKRQQIPSSYEVLRQDDILLIKADTESLERIIDLAGLELASKVNEDEHREKVAEGEINIIEAVVAPESLLIGKTAIGLSLRDRYGINVLAVARQGQRLRERLGRIPFVVGDILLIQGQEETLAGALAELGCLPLAEREMRVGKPRRILLATGIFGAAIAAAALNLLPAATALVCGAIVMVMAGLLSSTEAYKNIEWSIIVLLAAMIPIGQALETSGGAQLIADGLLGAAGSVSPALTIAILTTATMLLSNVINNAAAAILVAPIALSLARGLEASADPFLMAVAIGASCAFLTPIGHQSNTLVMAPGGYRFSDYWKMGLPLSLMVVATAVPLIMWFWPL